MRQILGLTTAALAIASPAFAADIARPVQKAPIVIVAEGFSGFHIGIQGGYGWSENGMAVAGADPIAAIVVATGAVPGSIKTEGRGWVLGGVAGYNWQWGSFVAGVETSINWSDIDGSQTQTLTLAPLGLPIGLTTTGRQELDWYGRLTGKVGFTVFDRTLVYFDGGAAYGSVKNSASVTLNAPAPFGAVAAGSADETKFGWTIGAGIEAAIGNGWRWRAGWEYMDFGSETLTMAATITGVVPVTFTATQENKFHVAKIGFSKGF